MKRFKKILYVNDATDDQAWAIERAVALAESKQADLTVVDVIPLEVITAGIGMPYGGPISIDLKAAVAANRHEGLEALVKPFKQRLNVQLDVLVGNTFLEVVRAVLKDAYDLVIKPAENPSWLKRLFGNTDMNLLRQCPCPVWLMKPGEKSNYNNILAAVDFDPLNPLGSDLDHNREILEMAGLLALSNVASLHLGHAWKAVGEPILLSRGDTPVEHITDYVEKTRVRHEKGLYLLGEELRKWMGVDTYDYLSPSFHLPKGSAKKRIPRLAAELQADLVVMGTIASPGISGLIIGNTAETIFDQLSCSVLAIKPPGFKTQVEPGVPHGHIGPYHW
jgi:nucleotide-binding universal stress UspA family protein